MVQQEVRKKTRIYGTIATLSAIVLVALIYVYGSTPTVFTPDTLPETSPMKTFKSYDELKNFLAANTKDGSTYYGGGPLDDQFFGPSRQTIDGAVPVTEGAGGYTFYSKTNVQVEGVDEADIVKTDGKYIYVATNNGYSSASQNNVFIVKADPQDPRVIAKISLGNNTYVAGLFLSEDSSKLLVIGSQYQLYALEDAARSQDIMIYPYYSSVNTFLSVYDVSDKASPVLARNLTLSGSYFNSRMIGNYVYAVVSQPTYFINNDVALPQVYEDAKASEIEPTRIYYADTVDSYFAFTTFIGLNIMDNAQEPTNITVLMGDASNMYVSLGNIYVTYPTWSEKGDYTSIYRMRVNGSELAFEAEGSVLGYVLNQYSMDEYNGYFRLATTSWNDKTRNTVYVLNSNLTIIGEVRLENAEVRETIHSVRFMGDKAYIVTFEQKDPFFVLDMSNPEAPKVSGELEIPGFSSYLHPYDENHVIGLGKEVSYVKLSLFDVSNVNAPTEIAKFIVDGDDINPEVFDNNTGLPTNLFDYTDSQALNDPKAFLFDRQKDGLLVIPMSTLKYGEIVGRDTTYWGQTGYWQGAYVFKVAPSGFTLRGEITHQKNTDSPQYYDYNVWVHRALYIGNTLYTVSNAKVLLNNLDTLALITEVNLS